MHFLRLLTISICSILSIAFAAPTRSTIENQLTKRGGSNPGGQSGRPSMADLQQSSNEEYYEQLGHWYDPEATWTRHPSIGDGTWTNHEEASRGVATHLNDYVAPNVPPVTEEPPDAEALKKIRDEELAQKAQEKAAGSQPDNNAAGEQPAETNPSNSFSVNPGFVAAGAATGVLGSALALARGGWSDPMPSYQ